MRYPVVIHKDEHSDFGVSIPDISGCYSAGNTYDDALTNAIVFLITIISFFWSNPKSAAIS